VVPFTCLLLLVSEFNNIASLIAWGDASLFAVYVGGWRLIFHFTISIPSRHILWEVRVQFLNEFLLYARVNAGLLVVNNQFALVADLGLEIELTIIQLILMLFHFNTSYVDFFPVLV